MLAIIDKLMEKHLVSSSDARTLYILELAMAKHGTLDPARGDRIKTQLEKFFPARSYEVNQALCRNLLQLGSESVVSKTLNLVAATTDQRQQMHYLYLLRNVDTGWTEQNRPQYLHALAEMRHYRGGAGMPGFIKKIKDEAAKTKAEKQLVYPGKDKANSPTAIIARRETVKQWKLSDLTESLDDSTAKFDFKSGKEMFAAAACVQCHRMGIEGAAIGPDLTFVANRFSRINILESILEPSKIVSEKYQNMKVVTREGETFVGRVDLSGDYRSPILSLIVNPLDPNQVTKIKRART